MRKWYDDPRRVAASQLIDVSRQLKTYFDQRAREYGGSEKQFADALTIYEVQGSRLDMAYLEEWSQGLNVSDLWERLKAEATPS